MWSDFSGEAATPNVSQRARAQSAGKFFHLIKMISHHNHARTKMYCKI